MLQTVTGVPLRVHALQMPQDNGHHPPTKRRRLDQGIEMEPPKNLGDELAKELPGYFDDVPIVAAELDAEPQVSIQFSYQSQLQVEC